ncbi:MAG: hypothetical protein Tsb0015_08440 [Simkaniaceae bacterium]
MKFKALIFSLLLTVSCEEFQEGLNYSNLAEKIGINASLEIYKKHDLILTNFGGELFSSVKSLDLIFKSNILRRS